MRFIPSRTIRTFVGGVQIDAIRWRQVVKRTPFKRSANARPGKSDSRIVQPQRLRNYSLRFDDATTLTPTLSRQRERGRFEDTL